ncbi:alpha/beta hydrolase [Streptomyces sp. UNOB3_S3]|uniref:alpha/beta hydrolase n=1 Tax=Streptomyces sp. UNOB3_S3 TaxID=2871682 RepID=UPI001E2843F9|nr:alpha/beta hydrolase [Streptomyces sp. UNOB3_S3]MCC3776029.1 alpha/beta hydrolase [Streptomyces sp. UNOB3_S3]
MTTQHTRKSLLFALATSAVAATLATPAQAAPAAAPALGWKPCADAPARECADLSVPVDYRDPSGPQARLAVSRLRTDHPEARRGTLLLIPGGPGGSGFDLLEQKGEAMREKTGGAYDIVSFDPRGTGTHGSSLADCGLDKDDLEISHFIPWPGPDGDIGENAARGRRIADACARNGGPLLRSFTTANEVRDIELLRQALGERKLSAYGVSYGAYVAAQYAQKHPDRTDRVVLDSSGDPDPARVARGWLANMAVGAADRFPDFAKWASAPGNPDRLADTPVAVQPVFLALAAKLDASPRTFADGHELTGNRLRMGLLQTLTSDKGFAPLAKLIRAARDTTGELTVPDVLPVAVSRNDAAVRTATICNDVAWPRSLPAYRRAVAADRIRHPLTAGMPVSVLPCAFWKDEPADKPGRITSQGPSNILMIQNLRDPNTPHSGALEMRKSWGQRARMVTVDSGGHGAYLANGNACGDRVVSDFLTTGQRPEGDVVCR